ncbi:hypothetical protein [Streptomyces sp. NRRL F-525]|uniref:hypothetical protein n=1 Tax=Streptomyces sp. NRRL F-525 TaxID=1463861 RepID=UPI0005250C97|nr:hypothetical protein [Streptomyces sp. NRRL F-525]
MTKAQQTPDRLVKAVQRVIEAHMPGDTLGVDVPSMARAIVRRVRLEEANERAAALVAEHDRARSDGGGA